ncbi:MAG: hypothetical protein SF162_05560 [bacterium]|nr:hypothetical protein [bacterium]
MSTSNNLPSRVLVWDDLVHDLQDLAGDFSTPLFIVGGAVRDAFLRRPMKDIDMATPGSGIALGRKIANGLKGDFYPLDPERDVGRALIPTASGTLIVDVARFRGADLESDLRDRDFTVNAMAVDLRGDLNAVIDPCGGEQDLMGRVLRRCSPHAIPHDPIRALRGVRQSLTFNLHIDPDTLRDMRSAAAHLRDTSPERVRDEFFHLLNVDKPHGALRIAHRLGLLAAALPSAAGWTTEAFERTLTVIEILNAMLATLRLPRSDDATARFTMGMLAVGLDRYRKALHPLMETHYPNERTHRALLLLSALLDSHDLRQTEAAAVELRLSNPEKDRLVNLARHRDRFDVLMESVLDPLLIHRYWRATGDAGIDVILLALARFLADEGLALTQDRWLSIIEHAATTLRAIFEQREQIIDPPVLVDGRALIAHFGLKPGPVIGELLDVIREAQVMGQAATAEQALEVAARYLTATHRASPDYGSGA